MKKLAFLIISALLLFSCQKQDSNIASNLLGEWHYHTEYEDDTLVDVYLRLQSGGEFELYQLIGEGRYTYFRGVWTYKDGLLSGTYADGSSWAASYKVEILQDALLLTCSRHPEEEYLYLSCTIPELDIY